MSSVKWARRFHDSDYPSILVTTKGSKVAESARAQRIEVYEINEPRNYLSLSTRKQLKKFFNEKKPSAIFNHLTRDLWHLSPVLKKFPEIKLYNFARMFIRDINKKDLLHKYIYSRLDGMIALSSIQKEFLLDCLPIPEEKYIVIPNAVDTNTFQPRQPNQIIREALGAKSCSHILVGLIGRLDELKGHREFVEAAAAVHSKYPETRFALVGANTAFEGESFAAEMKRRVHQLGLESILTFTDHRTNMPEVYNALDIFCMPSYEENFGNVMLEALACGVPSIGTDSGGTPEMVDHKKSGLLIPPKHVEPLANALESLISSPTLRSQISAEARKKAEDCFAVQKVFKKIESLL